MDKSSKIRSEPSRVLEQRMSKIDLTLGSQPWIDRVLAYSSKLIHFQITYTFVWMLVAAVYRDGGRLLGVMVLPFSKIALSLHNYDVDAHFHGAMGAGFYRNIVGETFFAGFLLGAMIIVVFCARYWRRPWRLCQFILERYGVKRELIATIILLLITAPFCFGLLFLIGNWYGFFSSDYDEASIALHQLGLWSMLASGCVYAFAISFLVIISGVCNLFKNVLEFFRL